jgi:hypothetical protein
MRSRDLRRVRFYRDYCSRGADPKKIARGSTSQCASPCIVKPRVIHGIRQGICRFVKRRTTARVNRFMSLQRQRDNLEVRQRMADAMSAISVQKQIDRASRTCLDLGLYTIILCREEERVRVAERRAMDERIARDRIEQERRDAEKARLAATVKPVVVKEDPSTGLHWSEPFSAWRKSLDHRLWKRMLTCPGDWAPEPPRRPAPPDWKIYGNELWHRCPDGGGLDCHFHDDDPSLKSARAEAARQKKEQSGEGSRKKKKVPSKTGRPTQGASGKMGRAKKP